MKNYRRIFLKKAGIAGFTVAAGGLLEAFAGETSNMFSKIALIERKTYEKSDEVFYNPARGFFPQLAVNSERQGLEVEKLIAFKEEHMSLILRIFYLEKFKDKALSDVQLKLIDEDLIKIREAGLKCILRFAYTNNMEVADAPLNIVEQHLDQLKPIFEKNKSVIAFVQAGFIGAWGEWHASSNGLATTENQRKVLFKLLSVLPSEIMVQVRTPGQKQRIFDTTKAIDKNSAFQGSNIARTGHHNDCFLATDTDYGTYSSDKIEAEKQYISDEALYVPTGGETCPPVPKENLPGCEYSINTMRHLKWTYLHLNYYKPTVNAWKDAGCFDDLQRNLGYRLSLLNSELPKQVTLGDDLPIKITIENTGFAPVYHRKFTSLLLKNSQSSEIHEIQIPVDIRHCKPASQLNLSSKLSTRGIPKGTYNLYLKISDDDINLRGISEYSIQLANKDVWDSATGSNNLKNVLKIA